LYIPENIDMVIFSGDCSNPRDPYNNEVEVRGFIDWYRSLKIPYKIFVAGNHDTSIEKRLVTKKDFEWHNIIYLENESVTIEGLKIFGSPYTPSFGYGWAFNKERHKLDRMWDNIIDIDTDIIINHGPPKGVLDISFDRNGNMERCGDKSLMNRVIKVRPKLVLFGHIHNCEDIINQGVLQLSTLPTKFSNGSVVKDGRFGVLSANGNVFEIETNQPKKTLIQKIKYELGRVFHKYSRAGKA
jgi:Icc-related predicted phosphoesterase